MVPEDSGVGMKRLRVGNADNACTSMKRFRPGGFQFSRDPRLCVEDGNVLPKQGNRGLEAMERIGL